MKIIYSGPSLTGVILPLPDGREIHVEHEAETPDLPADFAESLLEQESNWIRVKKKAAPKTPAKKKAAPKVDPTLAEPAALATTTEEVTDVA